MADAKRVTTSDVLAALRRAWKAPEYAFLPQVRNGTGYQRQLRTADALAMSLWPSRGIELHGFEIKVSRADWLREKKAPEKAEGIAPFCDRWWLVLADAGIVEPGEVPSAWGVLALKGKKLSTLSAAPARQSLPVDKILLASILRNVATASTDRAANQEELAALVEERRAAIEQRMAFDMKEERSRHEALALTVKGFEEASGVRIDSWNGGNVGRAVALVLGSETLVKRLRHHADEYERMLTATRELVALLDAKEPRG